MDFRTIEEGCGVAVPEFEYMELLAIMNAMQTWRWERWQKVPTSSPTSDKPNVLVT